MSNRMSLFSMNSDSHRPSNLGGPQTAQVSTTTLLNAIHNIYLSSQPHELESSTSLVVNTWLTAIQAGPTVDVSLAARAWEHARRRAEDGCIILGYVYISTVSDHGPCPSVCLCAQWLTLFSLQLSPRVDALGSRSLPLQVPLRHPPDRLQVSRGYPALSAMRHPPQPVSAPAGGSERLVYPQP